MHSSNQETRSAYRVAAQPSELASERAPSVTQKITDEQ